MFIHLSRRTTLLDDGKDPFIINDLKPLTDEDIKGYITDWVDSLEESDKGDITVSIPEQCDSKLLLQFVQLLVQYNINVHFVMQETDKTFDFEYLYSKPEAPSMWWEE